MNEIVYVGRHGLTMNVSRHCHNSWELIFCTSGEGRLVFDDEVMAYRAGEVAIIPPYISHLNISDGGFTNYHVNLQNATLVFKRPTIVPGNELIKNAFSAAFYHFSETSEGRHTLLSAYGNLLAAYMQISNDSRKHSDVVEDIISDIIRNYPDANYDLEGALRSYPFSYDYLRKIFKKEVGVTPHKYLTNRRLQAAADRLSVAYSEDNISDVARLCGFKEPLYFSRMFKKKYGVSPSHYTPTALDEVEASEIKVINPEEAPSEE